MSHVPLLLLEQALDCRAQNLPQFVLVLLLMPLVDAPGDVALHVKVHVFVEQLNAVERGTKLVLFLGNEILKSDHVVVLHCQGVLAFAPGLFPGVAIPKGLRNYGHAAAVLGVAHDAALPVAGIVDRLF